MGEKKIKKPQNNNNKDLNYPHVIDLEDTKLDEKNLVSQNTKEIS